MFHKYLFLIKAFLYFKVIINHITQSRSDKEIKGYIKLMSCYVCHVCHDEINVKMKLRFIRNRFLIIDFLRGFYLHHML